MILAAIDRLARMMAIAGGLVLLALVILTCVSVLGRTANTLLHLPLLNGPAAQWLIAQGIGPVAGDFELVESGVAFAIFAFLPYCQLHGGHATVDVFTALLPRGVNRVILAFWEVVLSAVILLIAWRLYDGLLAKIGNGETTFLLQFPVWWAYLASFVAALAAAVVAIYCAWARIAGLATGRELMPRGEGSRH